MKWKDIPSEKLNKSLILVSLILMIGLVGYMHKRHVDELERSISSIYEDRLVAKDYIFELSRIVNAKKYTMNHENDPMEAQALANVSIHELLVKYEKTRLTKEESSLLNKLKDNLMLSQEFENQIIYNQGLTHREALRRHLEDQYQLIQEDLQALSKIQLSEGQKLVEGSNKILASNALTHRLEIVLLIVIILAFFMIFPSSRNLLEKDLNHTSGDQSAEHFVKINS